LFCVGSSCWRWSLAIVVDSIVLVNDGGVVTNDVFAKERIITFVVVLGLEILWKRTIATIVFSPKRPPTIDDYNVVQNILQTWKPSKTFGDSDDF
jgi:hypothetical protein